MNKNVAPRLAIIECYLRQVINAFLFLVIHIIFHKLVNVEFETIIDLVLA